MTILSLELKELPSFSHVILAGGTALWIWQENLATDPSQVVVLWGSWLNLLDIPVEKKPKTTNKPNLSAEACIVSISWPTKCIAWAINSFKQLNTLFGLILEICLNNYLWSVSEVFSWKSRTETLPHWLSDSKINTARLWLEIFPLRPNV